MLLQDSLKRAGNLLFRFRTWVPFIILPVLLIEYNSVRYPFQSHLLDEVFEFFCLFVALCGETARVLTVGFIPRGTSGRNRTSQKAALLNTTGMYSIVRNPLYLGNYVAFMGLTLLFQNVALLIINTMVYAAVYVPIILVEEAFLLKRFGADYERYAARVPCLVPRLSYWNRPALSWSWRMVLRREHDTLFAILVLFAAISQWRDVYVTGTFEPDVEMLILAGTAFVGWIIVKTLKKWTNTLRQRPRLDENASDDAGPRDFPAAQAQRASEGKV